MFNRSYLVLTAEVFTVVLLLCCVTFAGAVQLPQTGQTKCYGTAGAEIACACTGQDGEIRAW